MILCGGRLHRRSGGRRSRSSIVRRHTTYIFSSINVSTKLRPRKIPLPETITTLLVACWIRHPQKMFQLNILRCAQVYLSGLVHVQPNAPALNPRLLLLGAARTHFLKVRGRDKTFPIRNLVCSLQFE